jgi:hypothetical protein
MDRWKKENEIKEEKKEGREKGTDELRKRNQADGCYVFM